MKIKKIGEIEEIWYQSSNIYYSKVDLGKKEIKKKTLVEGIQFDVPTVDVIIVFNRGAQYLYKGVEIHDYESFVGTLNREDKSSHGKSFNRHIKIYDYERLDDLDVTTLI